VDPRRGANADPPRSHSEVLARRLREQKVDLAIAVFPDDHDPPLGHEYQFDLDTDAGQGFLVSLLAFLRRRLPAPPPSGLVAPETATQRLLAWGVQPVST
jgi:hypothetical protein